MAGYRTRAVLPKPHEMPAWPAHVHHFVARDPRCARCLKPYHSVLCCHRSFVFWGHHYDQGYCHRTCYDCYRQLLGVVHAVSIAELEAGYDHEPMTASWWRAVWIRLGTLTKEGTTHQEALRGTFPKEATL